MFPYDPEDWDYLPSLAPEPPAERTYQLVLCTRCGCTYLDTCPDHGTEHLEKMK